MALSHSPKIVTDGLTFYYDMDNTQKSWKGKPTTNFISASPSWAGDGNNQTAFVKNSVEITDYSLTYRGAKTFLWSPGLSYNCYLQTDDVIGGTGTTSDVWTFSCYIRAEDRSPITSMGVYMYYPSSDGSVSGTITNAGDGWYRISRTRTGASSYISLMGFSGFSANKKYYLSGAMLTKDDMAVSLLNGNETRSNTQALLDLTGNNTITANSLTYNSDNTFSFNGTSDYISLPNDLLTTSSIRANGLTLNCWVKINNTSGEKTIVNLQTASGYSDSSSGGIKINDSTPQMVAYDDGISYKYVSGSTSIISGVWYNLTGTYNPSDKYIRLYVNGKEEGTPLLITTYSRLLANTTNSIGRRYITAYTNGNISNVSIYNRALSGEEVKQNFNALRGRFGV